MALIKQILKLNSPNKISSILFSLFFYCSSTLMNNYLKNLSYYILRIENLFGRDNLLFLKLNYQNFVVWLTKYYIT